MTDRNPYEVLNVHNGISQKQLKEQYYFLSRQFHPDKLQDPELHSLSKMYFEDIENAYKTLSSPFLRFIYDEFGPQGLSLYENINLKFLYEQALLKDIQDQISLIHQQDISIEEKERQIQQLNKSEHSLHKEIRNKFIYMMTIQQQQQNLSQKKEKIQIRTLFNKIHNNQQQFVNCQFGLPQLFQMQTYVGFSLMAQNQLRMSEFQKNYSLKLVKRFEIKQKPINAVVKYDANQQDIGLQLTHQINQDLTLQLSSNYDIKNKMIIPSLAFSSNLKEETQGNYFQKGYISFSPYNASIGLNHQYKNSIKQNSSLNIQGDSVQVMSSLEKSLNKHLDLKIGSTLICKSKNEKLMLMMQNYYEISFNLSYGCELSMKYQISAQQDEFLIVYKRPEFSWEIPIIVLKPNNFLIQISKMAQITLQMYGIRFVRNQLKNKKKSKYLKLEKLKQSFQDKHKEYYFLQDDLKEKYQISLQRETNSNGLIILKALMGPKKVVETYDYDESQTFQKFELKDEMLDLKMLLQAKVAFGQLKLELNTIKEHLYNPCLDQEASPVLLLEYYFYCRYSFQGNKKQLLISKEKTEYQIPFKRTNIVYKWLEDLIIFV